MQGRIKSHIATTGRNKDDWVPCKAKKRSCPISRDEDHIYFANTDSMKTYNQIENEFPEFSQKSALFSDILGYNDSPDADDIPLGIGKPRLTNMWVVKKNLSECEQAAKFGADVSRILGGDYGADDARDMQSVLWDRQGGGLTARKSSGSVIKSAFGDHGSGDIILKGGWEKRLELGQLNSHDPANPRVTAYIVGNGHTLAAIRDGRTAEGKPAYDVRLTTRDHPQSSMELMLDGDDDGSMTLDGDEYGKTLDHAVDAFMNEANGMNKHDASIRIDRYWIKTGYSDAVGSALYNFDSVQALSGRYPNTAIALDHLRDDIPYGKDEPGNNRKA